MNARLLLALGGVNKCPPPAPIWSKMWGISRLVHGGTFPREPLPWAHGAWVPLTAPLIGQEVDR
jgi:hypothetical protein